MQIELTPEQDDVVRHAIASGRIARPEEAVAQAMADWVERERQRAELIASLDEAAASTARGEGIRIETDEEFEAFFGEIEAEYRARSVPPKIDQR
jgi:Arc/MetJ-type ribon-helix-helix transcriptional regulator